MGANRAAFFFCGVFDGEEAVGWVDPGSCSFGDFGESNRPPYIMASDDEWEAPIHAIMAGTEPGGAPVRNDYDGSAPATARRSGARRRSRSIFLF